MNMKGNADSVAGYLYSHFILRDFAFLGSGTAFLFVASYLLVGCSNKIFDSTTKTLIFFGAAYFTGILMQGFCIWLNLFQMTPVKGPERVWKDEKGEEACWPLYVHQLHEYDVHPAALVAIERIAYLKQVATTFGSAAFFSVIFAAIHIVVILCLGKPLSSLHCWTIVVGIGLFFFCWKENRIKMKLQFDSVKLLKERDPETPKNSG